MLFEMFASRLVDVDLATEEKATQDELVKFLLEEFPWSNTALDSGESRVSTLQWGQFVEALSSKKKEYILDELKAVLYLCQGRIDSPYIKRKMGRRSRDQVLEDAKDIPNSAKDMALTDVYYALHQNAQEILTWLNAYGPMPATLRQLISYCKTQTARSRLVQIVTGPWYENDRLIAFLSKHFSTQGNHKKIVSQIKEIYRTTLPDLGYIAQILWENENVGFGNLTLSTLKPGLPIKPEKVEPVESLDAVWKFLPEACYVQPKFDGWQVQIHKLDDKVLLFGRGLENLTYRLQDVAESCKKCMVGHSVILDSEVIGIDPTTGKVLPFEETLSAPAHQAMVFDLIFLDGTDWYKKTYRERFDELRKLLPMIPSLPVQAVEEQYVTKLERLKTLFDYWVNDPRFEGIIVKKADGKYNPAGTSQGKWKCKNYISLDLVVLGYTLKGKSIKFLVGARDNIRGVLIPVGETDIKYLEEEVNAIISRFKDSVTDKIPAEVEPSVTPSIWVRPEVVIEVTTSGHRIRDDRYFHTGGYSLDSFDQKRFRYRPEKTTEDINSLQDFLAFLKPAPGLA